MKYQNIKAFEKHLSDSAPHNFCRVYLVLIGDDAERGKVLSHLAKTVLPPETRLERFLGSESDCKSVLEALDSPSLFGGDTAVFLDECEKWGKKEAEGFAEKLQRQFSSYLFLGAKGKTPLSKAVEKWGVVLDLSEEKPWDREKRISESLVQRAASRGKRLAPDATPLLLERIGQDSALLDQELDKLICYVGSRPTIERSDIFQIGTETKSYTFWLVAEEIVWEGGQLSDPASFHGLIPSIRSQLQLGLKIAKLAEGRVPYDEWNQYLPKMWPRTLEKRREQAMKKGSLFFQKGLELLFKIELLSRTGSNETEAMLDFFRASMSVYGRR